MFQNCTIIILFAFTIYLECNSLNSLRFVKTIRDLTQGNISFTHAESPVWDHENCILYWVDVLEQNIHALDYKTKEHRFKHIDYGQVNVVIPIANSRRLLVAVRSALYVMDWNIPGDAGFRLLTVLDVGRPNNVINEGKVDSRGRLWGGTKGTHIGNTVFPDEATLYSIVQPDFTPQVKVRPVSISNGLVWSLNNSILYYIDSMTKKIDAFDFVLDTGHISNRRTILDIEKAGYKYALPDGMTIDRDGMLWVALMFYGGVIRINPDNGVVMEKFKLPVSHVTSVTWGGEYLEMLFVTTSRRGLSARTAAQQTFSGNIFVLNRLGTGGVPDMKFAFDGADSY